MSHPSAFADVVPFCDLLVVAVVLGGFALSLRDAAFGPGARRQAVALAAGGFAVWYGSVSYLATRDVFLAKPDLRIPWLPVAVVLPVLLALTILPRLPSAARILDATPLSRLVGVQVLRVMGLVFLVEWASGSLPSVFALPAALGDIATGLLAIPVSRLAARRSAHATSAVILWSALGLADFVSALATGFLSSPGRFQVLALDNPNLYASAYPLALIPVFGVPIFIVLHALTLWKLKRESASPTSAKLMARPA